VLLRCAKTEERKMREPSATTIKRRVSPGDPVLNVFLPVLAKRDVFLGGFIGHSLITTAVGSG
jgi:hypothetical protein